MSGRAPAAQKKGSTGCAIAGGLFGYLSISKWAGGDEMRVYDI